MIKRPKRLGVEEELLGNVGGEVTQKKSEESGPHHS
jgi:hypothetical protein